MRQTLTYLLAPASPLGWGVRLLFWSCVIAATTLLIEFALGLLEPAHMLEHAALIVSVTTPLLIAVMWLVRHSLDMQEKLATLANRDPLTGIFNRRAFFEAMHGIGEGTVLMIDADHFKQVNDKHGHSVGDRVLEGIAHHIQSITRKGDVVGRLGGEEFAVFLSGTDEDRAREIGHRIAEGLRVITDGDHSVEVTLSVGGVHSRHADSFSSLVNLADKMLYAAKDAGRSRLVMWPQSA